MEPIVSSEWLHDNLNNPELIILDASQHNTITNYDDLKISKARFFDLQTDFREQDSTFPNTLPTPKQFEKGCQKLGITNNSLIVVYDNKGIYTSPRVWWLFKIMGHKNVSVLNGGLPNWIEHKFPTEENTTDTYNKGNFKANFKPEMVKDFKYILNNTTNQSSLLIDARSYGRFQGIAPEPRADLRNGHIPNSINLPYTEVLSNGVFKSKSELIAIFKNLKIESKPLTFSCGSGITACIILLACELISSNQKSVYDGSWTEWAQLTD